MLANATIDIFENGEILMTQWGRTAKDGTQEKLGDQSFKTWGEMLQWVEENQDEEILGKLDEDR